MELRSRSDRARFALAVLREVRPRSAATDRRLHRPDDERDRGELALRRRLEACRRAQVPRDALPKMERNAMVRGVSFSLLFPFTFLLATSPGILSSCALTTTPTFTQYTLAN